MKNLKKIYFALLVLLIAVGCSSSDGDGDPQQTGPNQDIITKLAGTSSKKWYWSASETGHLGFGVNSNASAENFYGNLYQATPFEKANTTESDCLYDNVLTFSIQAGELKFSLENGGSTYFNSNFLSVGGGSGVADQCLSFNASGTKSVAISDSNSFVVQNGVTSQTTGKQITLSDNGFLGYYIGQSTYEILSLTATKMKVRAVLGGNESLAVYHTFTTTPPDFPANSNFTNLIFSDEFDIAGAPNPAKWSYNLGNNNGWGNNESQYYTDRLANAEVQNGKLKITVKKENFSGFGYTSARLVSENKFDFTYGRAVIRAKLPTGGGTWPAIWMLGKNYPTNAWPACGEIDIMEHVGNQQNKVHSTLHYPGHFGGNGVNASTMVNTVSSEFHDYSVVWNEDFIRFYVDDQLYHNFQNSPTTPFNLDFFLILNVAMGGNFGGPIDANFVESSMEVEYVRVYQ